MDKTKNAVAVFDKRATEYQDKFMDTSLYHDTFDLFCDSITRKNPDILELACGPGNITRYLLNKRPDFKIMATDLSPNMIELARRNNPKADIQLMDVRDIATISKKYDGIICGFCLPYLPKEDAVKLISNSAKLLHPGGILYLSTMEDDYSKSGLRSSSSGDQLYIHFYDADYLSAALLENGFEIIATRHQDFPSNDETKITDLVIIAGK